MADPTDFPGANVMLMPPDGMEGQVRSMPVMLTENGCVSCWELTETERAEVARTGRVWLWVVGNRQPPVLVLGESPVSGGRCC